MDSIDSAVDSNSDRPRYRTRRSVLVTAIATGLVGLAGCSSAQPTPSTDTPSDQPSVDHADFQGDAFSGTLTDGVGSKQPVTVTSGLYEGNVVYDRSCGNVGNGLTGCDAGIGTAELGTVNFYYEHDMSRKPCLDPDQQVVLEVNDETAIVQRKQ